MRRRATRLCLVRAADPDPGAAGRGVRSVRCRQARHRFTRAAGRADTTLGAVAGGRALRLAYADPPYPGKARLYREHHDYAGEVNHAALIARLAGYDGWALSTSAAALPVVLALCPPGVAVAAWHRGERPTTSRRPLNGWEPVIYHGGRDLPTTTGAGRRVDSLVHGVTAMTTLPTRVIGAKPATFCRCPVMNPATGQPAVVTIRGSMRFYPQMLQVATDETAQGRIVLAPFAILTSQDQDGQLKAMLDELHLRKIDLSERIIVVTDQHGYIGHSTRAEMAYALASGKGMDVREFLIGRADD